MATDPGSTWGPTWPTRNPHIVTLVRDDGLRIPLHAQIVDLVALLLDLTELMGYDVLPGQTWGYAFRPIAGTKPPKPTEHARGKALDLNAPSNPQQTAAWHKANATKANSTFPFGLQVVCDIPEKVLQLWEDYGFRLGVKYKAPTKIDPMHVEYMGSVDDAQEHLRKLRAWVKDNNGTAPAVPHEQEQTLGKIIYVEDGPDKGKYFVLYPNGESRYIDSVPLLNSLAKVYGAGAAVNGLVWTWLQNGKTPTYPKTK